ncbi:MAG TPA: hypothetical protein DCZ43_01670 [candidate division Zixibacteria bacterium]|jgi:hypothetical protein|nr:hypothetical protein [candidate division Zixibacteria bacterium]
MSKNSVSEIAINRMTLSAWTVKSLVFQFLLTAAAVVLPSVAHLAGAPVRLLLPMHWPVILAAVVYGWRGGALVGAVSPIASYAISGYPLPMILPSMIAELFTYGLVIGLLRERLRLNSYLSVAIGLLTGRIVFIITAIVTGGAIINSTYLTAAMLPGLAAAICQLALLPFVAQWWVSKSK